MPTPRCTITEGGTEVVVARPQTAQKGPKARTADPFYNPAMELSRDLSVLVAQWFVNAATRHTSMLDGLAASGIRGVRLAREVTGDVDVTINDGNQASYELIQENIDRLGLTNATATHCGLHALLAQSRFQYIDIDPFGSPMPFLDAAVRSVANHGLLACTATDTAALCGVFPLACRRRYAAWPLHGPCMHEVGLRILLGALCRTAASADKGIVPVLSYSTDHYFRTYVMVHSGKQKANHAMAQYHEVPSTLIPFASPCGRTTVGPLWLGALHDGKTLAEVRTLLFSRPLGTKHALWRLLDRLEEEADAPAFFYTVEGLASALGHSMPPLEGLLACLREQGYAATRTHFSPTGFKTTAPWDVITAAAAGLPEHSKHPKEFRQR
jgi:tRNA (guanine26-N2/guanine27-N2)-dimethyltransferase